MSTRLSVSFTSFFWGLRPQFAVLGLLLLPLLGRGQSVVISEIYVGGGNGSAVYQNDYVELYNKTNADVDISNWSVQYSAAATVGTYAVAAFGAGKTIPAKGFFLVKLATGGAVGATFTGDVTGTMNLSASAGKVALVSNSTALVDPTGFSVAAPSATGTGIVDFVGYGAAATRNEGTGKAPILTSNNVYSIERKANAAATAATMAIGGADEIAGNGQDTDNNANDFVARATAQPQSSAAPTEVAPEVNVQQAGTDVLTGATFTGFAGTSVGSFSDLVFTIQNTGTAALTLGAFTFGGDYAPAPATTLPTSVAVGSSATFTVRFTPTAAGTRPGSVSFVNNDANENPYLVNFSAVGLSTSPTVLVTNTPAFTAFSAQVGTPSAAQTYTLQGANLTADLLVMAPAGFEVSSNGTSYATSLNLGTAAASYTISVRLTAAARGTFSGSITNESAGANTPNSVAVSGTVVAAPATYYLVGSATDPAVSANFNTVADGSGTTLTGFDVENATLLLASPATLTPGAAIGLLGAGSKFVLGNGAAAITLVLPAAGAEFTAPLDLAANATLQVLDLTPSYTLGTVAAASTVDFAQAGTFAVPPLAAPGYGSLTLTGGTKTFLGNTTLVRGSLVADGVTNLNGATSSPFSTIDLKGDFNLLNGTTFDPSDPGRFTLLLNSGTTQTLTGTGTDFALFRLTTATSGTAVALATTGGSSHLLLSNASGTGGYTLATGTTLALNGNNLTFVAGGNTSIGSGNGTLLNTTGSTLAYNHAGSTALGTLRLGAGERPARVVLNATGTGATLALPASAGTVVLGGLTLTAGTLDIGAGNTLQLDGPVAATAGLLQGSATSGLSFTGTSPVTGSLGFTASAGSQLQTLTLNQAVNSLIGLNSTLTIGNLTLTKGSLFFAPAAQAIVATLSGGSAESFANTLTMSTPAATTATLTFPLGASLSGYRPVTLATAQTAATATAYAARAIDANTTSRGLDNSAVGPNPPLTRTSSARYYSLNEAGTSNFLAGTLTLAFGSGDGVTDLPSLRLARSASASAPFADVNPGSTPATATSGTAGGGALVGTIADAVTALGDFALATTSTDLTINPLPVELTAFAARRAAHGVSITWATASEHNSASFEVQRSRDGREFTRIATVQAQGTSMQATAYAALDEAAPAGRLYYRLRQLDRDGRAAFSPLVAVAGVGEIAKVELYPNPAHTRISFIAETATPYRVLNQLGQPLLRGIAAAGTASIGLETLPAGLYFFELQTAAGRTVQKFEKE